MRARQTLLLVTSLVAMWHPAAFSADSGAAQLQALVAQKTALMERGYRDEDWPATIEAAHDVLMRVPGEPTALKWAGLALMRLGANNLARRALQESLRQREDEQARAASGRLARSFTTLHIRLLGLPEELSGADAEKLGAPIDEALTVRARKLAARESGIRGLPEAVAAGLRQRIKEIGELGGIAEEASSQLDLSGGALIATFPGVEVESGGGNLVLTLDHGSLGLEPVSIRVQLRAGGVSRAEATLRGLPSIALAGADASEGFLLDDKALAVAQSPSGRTYLAPGKHRLVRQLRGRAWPTDFELKPGERRTIVLNEVWPRVQVLGLKPGDVVTSGGHPVEFKGDVAEMEPGEHALVVRRGAVTFQVKALAAAGTTVVVSLPAVLRVKSDVAPISVNSDADVAPWAPGGSSEDYRLVAPGLHRVTVRAAHREPVSRQLSFAPGEEVTLDLPAKNFPLTPVWQEYEAAEASRRTWAWVFSGIGAGFAAGAGAAYGISGDKRAAADDAYAAYVEARSPVVVAAARQQASYNAARANLFLVVSLAAGGVAAACLGVGAYDFLRVTTPPEDSAELSAPPLAPASRLMDERASARAADEVRP